MQVFLRDSVVCRFYEKIWTCRVRTFTNEQGEIIGSFVIYWLRAFSCNSQSKKAIKDVCRDHRKKDFSQKWFSKRRRSHSIWWVNETN